MKRPTEPILSNPSRRPARSVRGMTLLEVLISSSIAVAVLGTAIGVFVTGTRSFTGQQAQSYVQFRTRTVVDTMARDARGAKIFLGEKDAAGHHYVASDGSDPSQPPTLILQLPSQDSNGLFYYGPADPDGNPYPAPNTLVMDTVIYWYNADDGTLRRTTVPTTNVRTNDPGGPVRSSRRAAETDAVVSQNVGQMRFLFKDRDGNPITSGDASHVSSVDFLAEVKQARQEASGNTQSSVAVSGVRLRNMRSGSIPGTVMAGGQPVSGATVRAIYTGTTGPYQPNTSVGEATTNADGSFEIYGLEPGTYSVVASAPGQTDTTVPNITVPEEDASPLVAVSMS